MPLRHAPHDQPFITRLYSPSFYYTTLCAVLDAVQSVDIIARGTVWPPLFLAALSLSILAFPLADHPGGELDGEL